MSDLELTPDEAGVLMQQMQGIGQRLSGAPLDEITPVLATFTADAMFQRPRGLLRRPKPISLSVTPSQAEILLRAIEDNDGLKDPSLREEARSELRATLWPEVKAFPALSLMKKLAHCASP